MCISMYSHNNNKGTNHPISSSTLPLSTITRDKKATVAHLRTMSALKIDFGMEQKITTLHPHASRSLLYIWFVAVAFQSEEALS